MARLKKVSAAVQSLRNIETKTCATLWPKDQVVNDVASLTQLLDRGPKELKRWKLPGTRKGARMSLASAITHYPMQKLDSIHKGSPTIFLTWSLKRWQRRWNRRPGTWRCTASSMITWMTSLQMKSRIWYACISPRECLVETFVCTY